MKKIIILFITLFFSANLMAAGSDSSSDSSKETLYDDAVKLVKRAGKLEKKDKKNPDILNYMGFTTRKIGNFDQAEKFYLEGLSIKPNHNGINEYLGELYVQTNRIGKAKERLEILKNCNCDEYSELELIIKNKGVKIY